jgi:hypothetical protein
MEGIPGGLVFPRRGREGKQGAPDPWKGMCGVGLSISLKDRDTALGLGMKPKSL